MAKNKTARKIGVIGCGNVGVSFIYFSMAKSLASEFVLIDVSESLRDGHAMDLQDAVFPTPQETKVYSGDYSDLKDADLIFISAGRPQLPGETRLNMLQSNKDIMATIARNVRDSGFQGIVLIASNPVDILTYVFYKESGFPRNKVIGSGTILDSSRLRYMIANDCGVSTKAVDAFVIGEHGDSSLVAFSQIKVAGQDYLDFKKQTTSVGCCSYETPPKFSLENYETDLERVVARRAYEIIDRKRFTHFGIGACISKIAEAVLNNTHEILPVGPVMNGEYGYENIVFGTPCVVGQQGVHKVVELPLTQKEKDKLKNSTDVIYSHLKSIGL